MSDNFDEKREFLRVDHEANLDLKILSGEELSHKYDVISRNISACGLLIRIKSKANILELSSIVWIKLDEKMLNICAEIERDLIIYKNGVFARVVRVTEDQPGKSYEAGVCFLRKSKISDDDIKRFIYGIREQKNNNIQEAG